METQTQRLVLVPIGRDHAVELQQMYDDPWLARWLGGPWTIDQARAYAQSAADAWRRDGVHKWMAYDRWTGALVGRGGLSWMRANVKGRRRIDVLLNDPGWRRAPLEMGWAVVEAYRGQGMAVEIGRAALDMAFEVLAAERVIAFTERHNLASRRVMEKLGMSLAGEIFWRGLVEGCADEQDDAPFAVYAIRVDDAVGASG